MPAHRFSIRGRVQGVGFRFAMCQQARRLGVTGWVRNRRDGSVEALAAGSDEQLAALQRWAQHGPAGALVESVDVQAVVDEALTAIGPPSDGSFRQAPTA